MSWPQWVWVHAPAINIWSKYMENRKWPAHVGTMSLTESSICKLLTQTRHCQITNYWNRQKWKLPSPQPAYQTLILVKDWHPTNLSHLQKIAGANIPCTCAREHNHHSKDQMTCWQPQPQLCILKPLTTETWSTLRARKLGSSSPWHNLFHDQWLHYTDQWSIRVQG